MFAKIVEGFRLKIVYIEYTVFYRNVKYSDVSTVE